jgi:hypothetical protein
MLEIRAVIDDLDYDSLADFLVPIIAEKLEEKGGFRALIAKNKDALSGVAKQLLSSMSQEKKDELLLQLLCEKKGLILTKANEVAARQGIGAKVLDLEARKI